MKKTLLLIGAALCIFAAAPNSRNNNSEAMMESNSIVIDEVFDYFRSLGENLKVEEKKHEDLFTPDFQMIINGDVIVDGREKLTRHFEHIISQVVRIDMTLHEKIVAEDKCIMRYDLKKPGKSTSKVIAIFKFRDGKVYEMNEVVHSVTPSKVIDFTSC